MKIINGGVYANSTGITITVTHLDKTYAAYVEKTGGVIFDDEETTVEGLKAALKGFKLVGELRA